MNAKEQQEWFELLEAHINNIRAILSNFNPTCREAFEAQFAARNMALVEHLQSAWENAPDKTWIHEIPSWGVFCDLCADGLFS